MKPSLLNLFSALSILLLTAAGQSLAQTPQRDNRPRTASISGRVTAGGKPAVNASIAVTETDLKIDGVAADGVMGGRIPFSIKARTDGDGRYLVTGLAEGRYVVSSSLKAFIVADKSADASLNRTVTLDEGEAREKVDFTLVRGGVITGKITDDEGAPLIAKRAQLYVVDERGQKKNYQSPSIYEMSDTDDRGVYRIYGLPPGRYIISAGGEGMSDPLRGATGKFALTYHPDTTDEKQAKVVEIVEGSEVTDVDIRLGNAGKTFEAAGRVIDKDTGKPVPGIHVLCRSESRREGSSSIFSTTSIADGQGNFRLPGLPAGSYQAMIADALGETGYTADVVEFEITNDNLSGVEVKAFLGASVSGVVVTEGDATAARSRLQSLMIYPNVKPQSNATDGANDRSPGPQFTMPARVNDDGSFTLKGLRAGAVSFMLNGFPQNALRIRRIERDGAEIREAIEVKPGEKIAGVRILLFLAKGRIRGQVQVVGGALPDELRLQVHAVAVAPAGATAPGANPLVIDGTGAVAFVDEKGRFTIDGLAAGEYDLSVYPDRRSAGGDRSPFDGLATKQRVTVRENDETPVTVTFDLNRKQQPKN